MYCSLRLFFDKTPDMTDSFYFLKLVRLIGTTLGYPIENMSYMLLDPNGDSFLINKKYKYSTKGIQKMKDTKIVPFSISKSGVIYPTCLSAFDYCSDFDLFTNIRVSLRYPTLNYPTVLSIDYRCCNYNKLDFDKYNHLIKQIIDIGFHVNNGFYTGYVRKQDVISFSGGSTGFLTSLQGKRNIENLITHMKHNQLDILMGIYYANSIVANALSDDQINRIREIVGKDNVVIENGILSFTLDKIEKMTPFYHLKYLGKIKKLEKLLICKEEK